MDERPVPPPPTDPAALAVVPGRLARRLGVLPLRLEAGTLHVAVEPGSLDGAMAGRLAAIRLATGVVDVFAHEHLGASRRVVALVARECLRGLADAARSGTIDAVAVLDALLDDAVASGASDLHLETGPTGVHVRVRLDGVLHRRMVLPSALGESLLARLKVLAGLDPAQRRSPQDGRFTHVIEGARVDVRVATLPTRLGERAALRLLPEDVTISGLHELGLPAGVVAALTRAGDAGDGLVLVCGPTGSGKTTTLHALLRNLAASPRHVMTLEDPVERLIDGVSQTQVDPAAGITFATGLRHLLRHDPDVLLVGEIRDRETGHLAVEAAQTGHLVLATLHAIDAPGAIERLVGLGVPRWLVVDVLRVAVAQRLLPLPCPDCVDGITLPPDTTPCHTCDGTGSSGRRAIAEALEPDPVLRSRLRHAPDAPETVRALADACSPRLRQVGQERVRRGRARAEDVRRVTPEATVVRI